MRRIILIIPLLASCAIPDQSGRPEAGAIETDLRAAPPPPRMARTVEQFDTTTEAQRSEAVSSNAGGRLIGTTVASLGDPGRPGFWIETSLVTQAGLGRLTNPACG